MSFQPTEEQQLVIDAFQRKENLVIEAGAGTGKTSTLRLLGNATDQQGVYFAYNRAIADEAKSSFPFNVRCSTAHSLAFRAVGKNYAHRLNGPRLPARELARRMGISEPLDLGDKIVIAPIHQARIVSETVQRFCYSADEQLTSDHVPWQTGLSTDNFRILHQALLPIARRAWDDLSSQDGALKFEHDHYLKIWGLSRPRLNCDFVMLDEAQDANPVLADIVNRQTHAQRILVGDANQAIYGWRGAVDAMHDFDGTRLYLSQSFRFGDAIADEANKWLSLLNSPLHLRGFEKVASRVESLSLPDAVLCRTNSGAVMEAISASERGRRAALVGGGDAIKRLAQASQDLQLSGHTDHPELYIFDSWAEVQDYATEDAAGSDLKVFVKMIDQLGATSVIRAIDQLVNEDVADVVISTAHKAKGREWLTVRVATDFFQPDEDKRPSREEMMLAYVTVTRAKEILDRGSLAYIDQMILTQPKVDATVDNTASQTAEPSEKQETEMATIVTGKHKGHVVKGELVAPKGIKITEWITPDGKPAPKKAGIVGQSFDSLGLAGKKVFESMNENYGTPENLTGRWMLFKEEGATKPVSSRALSNGAKATATKPAKSAKQTKNNETATKARASRKASAPTSRRKARMVIETIGDQDGVAKGKTKFWCNACMDSFTVTTPKTGKFPLKCSKGHEQGKLGDADVGSASSDDNADLEDLEV